MADTLLRSPDGTRERWCNEKEVAHLTSKQDPVDRWTFVPTSEEAPRDPHDVMDETPMQVEPEAASVQEAPVDATPTAESPVQRPKPKPLPKPKSANKGKGR